MPEANNHCERWSSLAPLQPLSSSGLTSLSPTLFVSLGLDPRAHMRSGRKNVSSARAMMGPRVEPAGDKLLVRDSGPIDSLHRRRLNRHCRRSQGESMRLRTGLLVAVMLALAFGPARAQGVLNIYNWND